VAESERGAGEGSPVLRHRLVRCLVLAGGTAAAWLLASGVASAAQDSAESPAAAVVTAVSPVVVGGLSNLESTDPASSGLAADGLVATLGEGGTASLGGLPTPAELPGLAVPAPLPAATKLPSFDVNLDQLTGDRPMGGLVASTPAVAADVPSPAAERTSARTDLAGAGGSPASAATPAQRAQQVRRAQPSEQAWRFQDTVSWPHVQRDAKRDRTPPIQEHPCTGLPVAPAPVAPAAVGATVAVEVAPPARPISAWLRVGALRRGPTARPSVADQPGTRPD
jgi:hypothetical protein